MRRWKKVKKDAKTFLLSGALVGLTAQQRANQYRAYVETQVEKFVDIDGNWQNKYLRAAYMRGLANAHIDLSRSGVAVDDTDVIGMFAHAQALAMLQARARQDLRKINTVAMQEMQDKVALAFVSGMPLPEVQKEADKSINRFGMSRSRQLVAVVIVGAVADAFLNRVVDFGISLVSPVVEMTFTTAGDDRVCVTCQGLSEKDNGNGAGVYTIQEARGLIPVHINCLTPDTLITAVDGVSAISKRAYEGDVIVITATSGKQITVTPNHPVLSGGGWVSACELNEGDKLFISASERVSIGDNDTNNIPSTIKKMFNSALVDGSFFPVDVPISAEDFHGDIKGRNSNVGVVLVNSKLRNGLIAASLKEGVNHFFSDAIMSPIALPSISGQGFFSKSLNSSSGSDMSVCNLCGSLFGGHSRPLDGFSFGLTSDMNPVTDESSPDNTSADTIFIGDGVLRDAAVVFADDFQDWQFDTVESAVTVPFSGHVYNLHTKKGYYAANNIITHNCRCTWRISVAGLPGIRVPRRVR
jgi:hypothetical protein